MTFCIVNITVSLTCRTRILQRKFFSPSHNKYGQAAMLTEELPKKSVAIPVSARVRESVC